MNFLSHYHLQRKPYNNYYTIGVTFPDILTLHDPLTVINRSQFTHYLSKTTLHKNQQSLLKGMAEHLRADKIFHSSRFFKEHIQFMQDEALKIGMKPIPEILRHILLEILMDRYLILNYKNITEEFYGSYSQFSFPPVFPLLHKFCNFKDENLLQFINRFISHKFLANYESIEGVCEAISRVNSAMKSGYTFVQPENYIDSLYNRFEDNISRFFSNFAAKNIKSS